LRNPDTPNKSFIKYLIFILIVLSLFLLPRETEGEPMTPAVTSVASTTDDTIVVIEKKQTVDDKIRFYSDKYKLNTELNLKVAKAESQLKNVCNYKYTSETGRYTACGIYQITRSTYRSYCGDPKDRFDIDKNIECAMVIMSTSGYHHWKESQDKWE